jgi:siroheme synthase
VDYRRLPHHSGLLTKGHPAGWKDVASRCTPGVVYAAKVGASLAHRGRARSESVATGAEKSGGSAILDRGKVKWAQLATAPYQTDRE